MAIPSSGRAFNLVHKNQFYGAETGSIFLTSTRSISDAGQLKWVGDAPDGMSIGANPSDLGATETMFQETSYQ